MKTAKTIVSVKTTPENIAIAAGGGKYAEGEKITLTASAVSGYHFLGWFLEGNEEALSTQTVYEIPVTGETAATAHYVAKYKEKCKHTNTEVRNAKKATCTEKGYTGDTYCKDCGEKIQSGTETDASGHTWDEGKVTKEPTKTEAGMIALIDEDTEYVLHES